MQMFLCCRHVILPKALARKVPKDRLMREDEWRGMGIQQSQGWQQYMIHGPGKKNNFFAITILSVIFIDLNKLFCVETFG